MPRSIEPCLCGDTECPRCFPEAADRLRRQWEEEEADYLHQREIDDADDEDL